jgi:hypothetical protein
VEVEAETGKWHSAWQWVNCEGVGGRISIGLAKEDRPARTGESSPVAPPAAGAFRENEEMPGHPSRGCLACSGLVGATGPACSGDRPRGRHEAWRRGNTSHQLARQWDEKGKRREVGVLPGRAARGHGMPASPWQSHVRSHHPASSPVAGCDARHPAASPSPVCDATRANA